MILRWAKAVLGAGSGGDPHLGKLMAQRVIWEQTRSLPEETSLPF
jgi:DUF917 family protein